MSDQEQTAPITPTKKKSNPHLFIYTLLIAGLAVSAFFNYMHSTAAKKVVAPSTPCNTFDQLPAVVRANFVDAIQYNELTTAYSHLEEELNQAKALIQSKDELGAQENEVQKKEVAEKAQESVIHPEGMTKIKEFVSCYDMDNADRQVTQSCRNKITKYVDQHPEAKYFEIIGIVDDLEFNLYENLEHNKKLYKKLRVDQRVLDKMKKFTQRGLAKDRASEASWVIKAHTGRKAATYNANYELISKHGYKGVIIRGYK